MSRAKSSYICRECGAMLAKWAGQCSECMAWNSVEESLAPPASSRYSGYAGAAGDAQLQPLSEISPDQIERLPTSIGELDRVLGGGLVTGSAVLIGGDPGIGKSTLLLQAMAALSRQRPALYVTGEESPRQVSLRAQRMGEQGAPLQLLAETSVEQIIAIAERFAPEVMVVDSIQTIHTTQLQSAPGSVAQVRESAAHLVRYAKRTGTALFLVGHVTKEGTLAGPRVLEHMVDTVLYFEGDNSSRYRVVRAFKNRFGAINELGVFAMTEQGLRAVSNPSAIFLSRHPQPVAGSVVMVTREGSRPLLVEVQALVDESRLANPRRLTLGLEQNRLSMLLAVLHRHGGVAVLDQDVFVNVVGGVRVSETAADLAVMASILSSLRNRPLANELVIFGEVGLAGEIRPVPNGEERLNEAAKHGFSQAVVPAANCPRKQIKGMVVYGVERLDQALEQLWNG